MKSPKFAALYWRKRRDGKTYQVIDRYAPFGLFLPLGKKSSHDRESNQSIFNAADAHNFFGTDRVDLGSVRRVLKVAAIYVSDPWPSVIEIIELDDELLSKATTWRRLRMASYPFHSH
jgi:hypothetical protein